MDPLNHWKCTVCNVMEHINNKIAHMNSKRHHIRLKSVGSSPWTCDVCAWTMSMNNRNSHLAGFKHRFRVAMNTSGSNSRHAATSQFTNSDQWTCDFCNSTMHVNDKESHLITHTGDADHQSPEQSLRDVGSPGNGNDNSDFPNINDAGVGGSDGGGTQPETAFQNADDGHGSAQRLQDLQTQLDATEKELTSVRKAWDEKEYLLLSKTDELRAKIVSLDGDLDTMKTQYTTERTLRMSVELELAQEKTRRIREAEVAVGLNTKVKEALDEKERLTTALERKVESIRTGQSVLSLARTKLSDVTSARDALVALTATLTATVDTLRKENATQASQIQTLQQQLDLANERWSSHGQEIADEQLVWKDEEQVEAEKRQQEENIRQARERLEQMRREELKQKAEEEAREKQRAEEKRAREAEEEETRRQEAERLEEEKRQAYECWRNASAQEFLRHESISRTRFQANRGVWTNAKALDRFLKLHAEFPTLTFSAQQPLTFWSVPWPILVNPLQLAPGKVDWQATEAFFIHAKKALPAQEYGLMVARAQRTFHPDRWVGKLALILDDDARELLRKVINTVAQVINGLLTR